MKPRQITPKELSDVREKLIREQHNACVLCGTNLKLLPARSRCVDHDHTKTGPSAGAIRGVLCSNCNGMEGKIFNRANRAKRKLTVIEWLENLLNYWKLHSTNQTGLIHPKHGQKKRKKK